MYIQQEKRTTGAVRTPRLGSCILQGIFSCGGRAPAACSRSRAPIPPFPPARRNIGSIFTAAMYMRRERRACEYLHHDSITHEVVVAATPRTNTTRTLIFSRICFCNAMKLARALTSTANPTSPVEVFFTTIRNACVALNAIVHVPQLSHPFASPLVPVHGGFVEEGTGQPDVGVCGYA